MGTRYIKQEKKMEFTCDACPSSDEYKGSWRKCINQAKNGGWKITKDGDNWHHACDDDCLEKLKASFEYN
ncbi:unnamed protein product [marine sediment metagenome]|uniref:MYM-type domain-containing protein n=1 Tax=marine sediment metagenome TaxID=412755 RepID=X0TPM4_9ZZZZ